MSAVDRPAVSPRVRPGRVRRLRPRPGALAAVALAAVALVAAACGNGSATPGAGSPSPTATAPSASPTAASSASGPASPGPSASTGSVLDRQLQAVAGDILDQVAQLRGLAVERPVETRVLDQAGLDAYVKESYARDHPPSTIATAEGIDRRLGLLRADESLGDLTQQLLGSQVLGLYEPRDKSLYVIARGDSIGGLEKFTMSHELDHALQDQHFDLERLLPRDGADLPSDVALARRSVAEGDASLLMTQWASAHMTPQELADVVKGSQDPAQQALLERMPAILVQPLEFPYTTALQFVVRIWSAGGWSAVDRLYADPPASTEQILHPEKYTAREAPVPVALPADLAARMGAGWTVAGTDTMGEFLTSIWLSQPTSSKLRTTPATASAGWGGDRLAYLTGPGGSDVVVWRTAWDSRRDADEFLDVAGTLVGNGIGTEPAGGTVIRASDKEVVVILASDGPTLDAAVKAAGFPG